MSAEADSLGCVGGGGEGGGVLPGMSTIYIEKVSQVIYISRSRCVS